MVLRGMSGTMRRLLYVWILVLATYAGAGAAWAADPAEVSRRVLAALEHSGFSGDIIISFGEEKAAAIEGRIHRVPPGLLRVERYVKGRLVDYYLEDCRMSARVIPAEKRAFLNPGPRFLPLLSLIGGYISAAASDHRLEVTEGEFAGRSAILLQGFTGPVAFTAVVGASDWLPREFTAARGSGSKGLRVVFANMREVSPRDFPPGFFVVPPGYAVVGRTRQLPEQERRQLRSFGGRLRSRGERAEQKSGLAAAADAASGEFLPALPTRLPPGFRIDSVTPLFFNGRLLYHVELVHADKLLLVSLFETRDEELRQEFQAARRNDGEHILACTLEEDGVHVILVSEDLGMDELERIYRSLEFRPELALPLIDRALEKLLSE